MIRAGAWAAALAATALLAAAEGQAQARPAQVFECRGENACRVACFGVADIGRVQRLVIEEWPWAPGVLLLTVTHDFGVTTMLLRGTESCRMDNLAPAE